MTPTTGPSSWPSPATYAPACVRCRYSRPGDPSSHADHGPEPYACRFCGRESTPPEDATACRYCGAGIDGR